MWFVLVVAAIFALMVLAGVSTARRNRRGMTADWYTRHATDRQLEAEWVRRDWGGGF